MSDIDLVENRLIGNLAGVPLYHPLGELKLPNLSCSPSTLVLGGGGGEHSAVVIPFDTAAWWYLNLFGPDSGELEDVLLGESGVAARDRDVDWSNWTGDEWFRFVTVARSMGMRFSYDEGDFDTIEHWVLASVGEVALVHPDLGGGDLQDSPVVQDIAQEARECPPLGNVVALPQGYAIHIQ